MRKYFFKIACLIGIFLNCYGDSEMIPPQAVTYTLSGGRFGDNLIAYMHAKWISLQYKIPLIYKPFPLSELLLLDDLEVKWTPSIQNNFLTQVELKQQDNIHSFIQKLFPINSVLYTIPYFPESKWELSKNAHRPPFFPYFPVDWESPEFRLLLKTFISPKQPIVPMVLPKDKITVAVHIRTGGGYDDDLTRIEFPLKFFSNEFYISELLKVYHIFNEKPLYVYLFTDDLNPRSLKEQYEKALAGFDIEIDCREKNRWDTNVLEDFFALTQFDCAIHGESNFAVCAGFLANYKVEITPKEFHIEKNKVYIDEVTTKIKMEN